MNFDEVIDEVGESASGATGIGRLEWEGPILRKCTGGGKNESQYQQNMGDGVNDFIAPVFHSSFE